MLKSPPVTKFLTGQQYLLVFILIGIGLWLRWQDLAVRPIHYQEALHAIKAPGLLAWSHWLFGAGTWALRFPAALLGSLLLFCPLLLKKKFPPISIILTTAFIALSPTLVYWSRFLIYDSLVFLTLFGMLFSFNLSYTSIRPIAFFFLSRFTFLRQGKRLATRLLCSGISLF